MNEAVCSARCSRVFEFSSTNTAASPPATRWARAGSSSAYDTMNVSKRRGSLVVATGSGTEIVTDDRRRSSSASSGAAASPCSRATRVSTEALSSCCDTARNRSSLSNGAEGPTMFGETPAATTAMVALDLYCFGRNRTSAAPTPIDVMIGTISHHLRRPRTDR
jgi:hypothetical protein